MKSEDRARVFIGKSGHRIYNERDGLALGIVKLVVTGDDVAMTMAEPGLSAGSVLGRNDDYENPTYYTLSPAASFVDAIDSAAEQLERISTGAYSISAPANSHSQEVPGYWVQSKYARLLMKSMVLGGTEIARAVLLQDLSVDDLRNGTEAYVQLKGEISASELRWHYSVRTETDRAIKIQQLKESGIDVLTTQGSASMSADIMQHKKQKPWK